VVAFITATVAGLTENYLRPPDKSGSIAPDLTCPVDACCDGATCPPQNHRRHHSFSEKIQAGFRYALLEVWGDLVHWFFLGLILAGLITAIVPSELMVEYLGEGLPGMFLMLAMAIPIYICATASTPIAAALILKGVSPGAALVFLLAGPATNVTSLTMMAGVLGKRTTAVYLSTIAVLSVLFGLVLDSIYAKAGISAQAVIGQAAEIVPSWAQWIGAIILLVLSLNPLWRRLRLRFQSPRQLIRSDQKTSSCGPT
jgi:uncharacterized membrane protein YraQ (UPF0718 family)